MVSKTLALKVLIIEKNREIQKILKACLIDSGACITHATSLEHIPLKRYQKFSLLIIDADLESSVNASLIKEIRYHDILLPIIMIGQNHSTNAIKAYQLGINIYHPKPIICDLLKAQIANLTSYYQKNIVLELEDIRIDVSSQSFYVHNKKIVFTYQEFQLLLLLVAAEGRILSRKSINRHFSCGLKDLSYAAIDTLVSRIRSKLNKYLEKPFIKTEYKLGYRVNPIYLRAHYEEKDQN